MQINRNKSTDRRAVYTRKVIRDAFIELLNEMPIEKVTISKICSFASINRSTFYLHYEDITQVSEEIENDLFEQITNFINRSLMDEKNSGNLITLWYQSMAKDPLYHVIRNRFGKLTQRIVNYSKDILVELCIKSNQLSQREAEIWATYYINGVMAVCYDFLDRGYENHEQENAFLNKIVYYGNSFLDMHKINEMMKSIDFDSEYSRVPKRT